MAPPVSPLLLAALTLSACGGAPRPGAAAVAGDDARCPTAVRGTSVGVEDTLGGAALVFVTTGEPDEVRARARELARLHNKQHAAMGPLPSTEAAGAVGGGHAGHGGHGGHGGAGEASMNSSSQSDQGAPAGHAGQAEKPTPPGLPAPDPDQPAPSDQADHSQHAAPTGAAADKKAGNAGPGGHAGHGGAGSQSGQESPTAGPGAHGLVTIHSRAEVEDIAGGARVVFTSAPGDVIALATQLRMRARQLATGACDVRP